MRYVLAAIFVGALGMPAASALPTFGSGSLTIAKSDVLVDVARRSRPAPARQSRAKAKDDYGIHPLVGSGGY